tara:strand:+ start:67 stop:480 length:414 start_codon:yes stop_codon:yes gene_type:complete
MKPLTDEDLNAAGKVLLVIVAFVILLFSTQSNAQTYTISKSLVDSNYVIDFEDEFIDNHYFEGQRVKYYGKLDLTENEYKQLIKDIKKSLKQKEIEIDRANYAVLKYGWVKDTVWVYYDEKAFSVTKKDISILNSKL